MVDALELMTLLDRGENMFGALTPAIRARLFAVLDNPTEETWDDAHTVIIRMTGRMTTLWQAALLHTDFGVTSRKLEEPWPKIPTQQQLLHAIRMELADH